MMVCKEQFEITGDGLLVRAPAKINLSLLIAGKRPDSFHEIETIMAKVTWYDELLIQQGQKPGIELICKGPCWAPAGKENLICQACEMLLDSAHLRADIKITLTKNIPAGSGLGSASSDAAATLMGLARFLQLGIDKAQLTEMAAALGSDVAFFLDGPLALCTGKGEKIKKLGQNFNFSALIILPGVTASTKKVYDNYKHNHPLYEKLKSRINGYVQKNRIDSASKMCANMLQASCFDLHKELTELKAKVESVGLGPVCVSGSGSAMFCVVDSADEKKNRDNKRKIEDSIGCKSIIVSNNRW